MTCCKKSTKYKYEHTEMHKLSVLPDNLEDLSAKIKDIKICLAGNTKVGKSVLFSTYYSLEYEEVRTTPLTMGCKAKVEKYDGISYNICIWDTAGEEEYMATTKSFYKGCKYILLLFSRDDETSYNEITTKWIPFLKDIIEINSEIIIFENKSDLECNFDRTKLMELCKESEIKYIIGSGKLGNGIREFIDYVLKKNKN